MKRLTNAQLLLLPVLLMPMSKKNIIDLKNMLVDFLEMRLPKNKENALKEQKNIKKMRSKINKLLQTEDNEIDENSEDYKNFMEELIKKASKSKRVKSGNSLGEIIDIKNEVSVFDKIENADPDATNFYYEKVKCELLNKKLTVFIEKGKNGWLCGQIFEYPAALSQGKTKKELIVNLMDCLKLLLEIDEKKSLKDNFKSEKETEKIPNKKTLKAMAEAEKGKLKKFKSVDALIKNLKKK